MNFEMTSFNSKQHINQVLTHHDLLSEITNEVLKVQAILHIRQSHCLLLLQKFNWDREAIRESYHASSSFQQFMTDNGMIPKVAVAMNMPSECTVCCTTEGELLGLACGDMACGECWRSYLTGKIEEGVCLIECMDLSCNLTVCTEKLGMLLDNAQLLEAHKNLVIEDFVENSANFTWCNKKCGMAVSRNPSGSQSVVCSCGSKFCFSCGNEPHLPATCRQIQLWNKKCADQKTIRRPTDGVSLDWLLANTKECPKCLTDIQKNGGCSHMKCTKRGCGHGFCWDCRQSTFEHRHLCDRSALTAEQNRLKSRPSLHIFAQYFHRFEQQKQFLIEEQRLDSEIRHADLQYSLTVLLDCRETLMNSHVFSYYLKEGSYGKSLEKLQKILEKADGQLSELLKNQNEENAVIVLNQSGIVQKCQKLRKSLLAHCTKGHKHEDLGGRKPIKPITAKTKKPLTQAEIDKYFAIIFLVIMLFVSCAVIICMILDFFGVI